MKQLLNAILFISGLGVFALGCDGTNHPTGIRPEEEKPVVRIPKGETQSAATTICSILPQGVVLTGFQVDYAGRTFVNNQTTFTYMVSGPAVDMHFRLELPSCAPAFSALSPTNGTTTNNDAFINPGVEWHPSVGSGTTNSFTFSITYPGNVREGIVLVSVKTTSTTAVGEIAGACARVFDISGTVFTDADEDGVKDASETGIANVTVNLLNSSSMVICTAMTNATGGYIFETVPAGNYTVEVDANTVASTGTTYVGASTPTTINIAVGPNSTGNDFGFAPKTAQLINDLKFGILSTNGKSATFWKKQLQVAITGKGTATVSTALLQSFVVQIRALLLPDPFLLPGVDGLQAAFDILDRPVRTDRDKLVRELLAAEFNQVSGRGISGTDEALQLLLLGWGEALVVESSGTAPVGASSATSTIGDAIDVFSQLNRSGGSGGEF